MSRFSKPGITITDTLFTNGARVIAEPPSPRALRTLRQIIARAPPRIKKQNGHYQQIGRRLTDDFLAEEMVGHDLDLLVRVWQPAIGRVATTSVPKTFPTVRTFS